MVADSGPLRWLQGCDRFEAGCSRSVGHCGCDACTAVEQATADHDRATVAARCGNRTEERAGISVAWYLAPALEQARSVPPLRMRAFSLYHYRIWSKLQLLDVDLKSAIACGSADG